MAKLWERPWTSEEMKENAGNWNLAGDAGLLQHLQQFSQDLVGRIHSTNSAMDDMFRKLNNVATEINNVNNTFLSLANTQFVENRVYEDEEKETPTAVKELSFKQAKSKEATEAEMIQRVKQSLEIGFGVMDTKFNAIEVSGSDSEDEGSPSSVIRTVLEPKNPYLHRPLPHLIGSTEFMGDDSVGLITTTEDVMTPPLTTHSSNSDLQEDLVEESRDNLVKQASDWLSETEDVDMFGRDSSPDELEFDVPKSQQVKSTVSFAEELSSKLGGVASSGISKKSADLWNEPTKPSPALNDTATSQKSIDPPAGIPSLFGPSNDLFRVDDDEDDIFTVKDKKKSEVPPLFEAPASGSQIESNFAKKITVSKVSKPESKHIHDGVFSSTPDHEDEGSFVSPTNISRIEKQSGLFDDDDDTLFSVPISKPINESSIARQQFNETPSAIRAPSNESLSIPSESTANRSFLETASSGLFSFADNSSIPSVPENTSDRVEKSDSLPSLPSSTHGSESRLSENFPNSRSSLFDEDYNNDSLFQSSSRLIPEHVPASAVVSPSYKKTLSLFEDDESLSADDSAVTEEKVNDKSLFDDEDLFPQSTHGPNYDIFGSSQGNIGSGNDIFAFESTSAGVSNIFNPRGDETDDIFSVAPQSVPASYEQGVEDLFSSSTSLKLPSNEPKINPPLTLSIKMPDLFFDGDDDSDFDLFGMNSGASSKDNSNLFETVPSSQDSNEKGSKSSPQTIIEKQVILSEPLHSKNEKTVSKSIANDKENNFGSAKAPLPAPRKERVNEPFVPSIDKEEITQTTSSNREKIIGKIKSPIGFVVDPLALLPGSKPPPRDKSSGHGASVPIPKDANAISIDIANSSKADGLSEIAVAIPSLGGLLSPSFGATEAAPTLHSVAKERAKIQVKRRPQSRRARHEAIRSSALFADDVLIVPGSSSLVEPDPDVKDSTQEKSNHDIHNSVQTETSKAPKIEFSDKAAKEVVSVEDIMSPSTDEEDLFGVPQVIYKDKEDLEDQLFGSATVLSPYGNKQLGIPPKVDLRADSQSSQQSIIQKYTVDKHSVKKSVDILSTDPFSSDENLFASSTLNEKNSLFSDAGSSKTIPKTDFGRPKGTTKSLFDDEDDDDIFSKPTKTFSQTPAKSGEAKLYTRQTPPVVKASMKKIEDAFEDPLTSPQK